MADVAGRKAKDNVTNAKSGAALEGWGQIKAVRADPVSGDVGDKAGNEEALFEMQVVNDCEETKSTNNSTAKKKPLFLKLPKISLGKTQLPKQMTTREIRLLSKKQKKINDAALEKGKRLLLIKQNQRRSSILNGRRSLTGTITRNIPGFG